MIAATPKSASWALQNLDAVFLYCHGRDPHFTEPPRPVWQAYRFEYGGPGAL